jgi:hypothetical protein
MTKSSRLNRRRFIQATSALTGAGVFAGTSNFSLAQESPNERPVFATIGLRNQGWTITNKSTKFADFAAFADVDANVLGGINERLKEETGKAADGYSDYRKVLERDDIDAVMIATPDHWHTKIAVEAMLAGKDVYCEKPLTLTIAEGKLIEKIVEQTGRVFQVGTMLEPSRNQGDLWVPGCRHGNPRSVPKPHQFWFFTIKHQAASNGGCQGEASTSRRSHRSSGTPKKSDFHLRSSLKKTGSQFRTLGKSLGHKRSDAECGRPASRQWSSHRHVESPARTS